jgi:hypothetical protein
VVHFLIMHVTLMLIVAFFILFAAQKAEGFVALLGNVLGIWVVIGAILLILSFFMPGRFGMMGPMHDRMAHGPWMHHWGEPPPAPAPPAQPAQPMPPPAPKKS